MTKSSMIHDLEEGSWESIEAAFAQAAKWPIQALGSFPKDYAAGEVRLGWHRNALVIFADLPDTNIWSNSKQDHDPLWELGDVFEIFIKRESTDPYLELHVSPNNHCLQLRFPNAEALPSVQGIKDGWRTFIVSDRSLFSWRVRIDSSAHKWQVFARIPWQSLAGDLPVQGDVWRLSCCRYDYGKDLESPVLSSTSAYQELSYHRQQDWQLIEVGR